ncbi:type II CRISPR RNA-guided endonuclease Cas9 [Holzapfeliella floricola]|uniref:CRISPR-associated endonuclease Cas9 n=2 Tax=Holzapfeliella TaxID=2767883 RepID=A0A0R2DLB6_9LACO|nr:type II CRISPR RNA-guided endonuclease Cas9 [Holzapfeliella floricola]KRN04470.1 CRISPR-associated protein, Csn1 family [Holzapfeliella floricola DSM 23037 = JCM 16512]
MTYRNYHIGLDIGTSSVGFAVRYDNGELVHKKGSNLVGARLFKEGETAEERRLNRGARRRYNRRKWRLNLLNQIFKPLIEVNDPTFFKRLEQSNLVNYDKSESFSLLNNQSDDKLHQQFPTIYHLRDYLMKSTEKADIRLIYLAVHHIVKYRGNFLDASPVDSFEASNLKVDEILTQINLLLDNLTDDLRLNTQYVTDIEQTLLSNTESNKDKEKVIQKLLLHKEAIKIDKDRTAQIAKLVLGYKADIAKLFGITEKLQTPKLELSAANSDDALMELSAELNEDQIGILLQLKTLYSRVRLNQIIPSGTSLSKSMIEKYELHHTQLKSFKENILLKLRRNTAVRRNLELAYALYVGNAQTKQEVFEPKKARFTSDDFASLKANAKSASSVKEAPKNTKTKLTTDDFYNILTELFATFESELSADEDMIKEVEQIKKAITGDNYLPKQRTDQNGNIPHQLHQIELRQILQNQLPHYPEMDKINEQKPIEKLVTFRVPYYIGPLITPEDQQKSSAANFAWMKRKEQGAITPWNFDDKVDRMQSATNFIKRMTVKDTYLINEDVLPDRSLLYQRFKVLNELNLVKVNNQLLSIGEKQAIYHDLFEKQKTVSTKKLQSYLQSEQGYGDNIEISGLSNPDKFNNGLTTYIDFKNIFGDLVEDTTKQKEFEQIIEWSTVFEDRAIFKAKLQEVNWLTEEQIKALVAKRYSGWGRLSYRLLAELVNDNGERIIDILWNNKGSNLMSIVSQDEFQQQIARINSHEVQELGMESVLANAYTSPQNKKAIRQVMKVVDDIQLAMNGQAPTSISIEFTRKPEENSEISKSRYETITSIYQSLSKDIEKEVKDNLNKNKSSLKKNLSDKYYLYFTQLGRDIYTNQPIPFNEIPYYDIDHIVPRSVEMNDSLNNRVLVAKSINQIKKNNAPIDSSLKITSETRQLWKKLLDSGLITKQKYYKLSSSIKNTVSPYVKQGFINRQLVETSQVIKLVANILGTKYQNDDTEIIEVKAHLNSEIRKTFEFYKLRELNDYHHGFDAYLTTLVGGYLYNRYPKLRSYFVYGDHKRLDKAQLSELKNFNFLHGLTNPKSGSDGLITASGSQQVVLDRNETIKRLNKIYRYKYMLISREVFTKQGQFYNETIYPAKPNTAKMIPLKDNKPSEVYGGYSSSNVSKIALIKEKNTDNYQFIGIPIRSIAKLKQAKANSKTVYQTELNRVIKSVLASQKTKKQKEFEVILDNVKYNQVVVDQGEKYYLGSPYYKKNAKQLVISPESVKILADKATADLPEQEAHNKLMTVYQEIVDVLNKHFALYDINNVRKKLNDGLIKFSQLPNYDETSKNRFDISKSIKTKYAVIMRILSGIKNQTSEVPELGLKSPLNKMQTKGGIKISPEAKIYYSSPTGIFSHFKQVKNL